MMQTAGGGGTPSVYEVWYTTTDGQMLNIGNITWPNTLVSHTYTDKGIITYQNPITNISSSAFNGQTKLLSITMPDSITWIDSYAFTNCTSLVDVKLPDSLAYIRHEAFSGCTGILQISLSDTITDIQNGVFDNCRNLYFDVLPASLISMGRFAFRNTKASITSLPANFNSIGYYAFGECSNIHNIKILNTNEMVEAVPVTAWNPYAWPFPVGTTIQVPSALLSQYQANEHWNQYTLVGY